MDVCLSVESKMIPTNDKINPRIIGTLLNASRSVADSSLLMGLKGVGLNGVVSSDVPYRILEKCADENAANSLFTKVLRHF